MNNEEVERVWNSEFGRHLFNTYSLNRPDGPRLLFSKRVQIVKYMIAAMLERESIEPPSPREATSCGE